jgi:hypothetical protein
MAFGYAIARAEVMASLGRGVWVEIEDQRIAVGAAKGNVLKLGGAWFGRSVAVRLAGHAAVSGTLLDRSVTARLEAPSRRIGWLAGATAGRVGTDFGRLVEGAPARRTVEAFGGGRLRLGRGEITAVLDRLWSPGAGRTSILLAAQVGR